MGGMTNFASSCMCLLVCLILSEAMPRGYRQLISDKPFQKSTKPVKKAMSYVKEKLPPYLATDAELKEYINLVTSAVRKSPAVQHGEELNTLHVDDLMNAKLKRAVLPEPFKSTVQLMNVKLEGHFPKEPSRNVKCQISFEWVTVFGKEDAIVSSPLNFVCSSTNGTTSPDSSKAAILDSVDLTEAPEIQPSTKINELPKTAKKMKQFSKSDVQEAKEAAASDEIIATENTTAAEEMIADASSAKPKKIKQAGSGVSPVVPLSTKRKTLKASSASLSTVGASIERPNPAYGSSTENIGMIHTVKDATKSEKDKFPSKKNKKRRFH